MHGSAQRVLISCLFLLGLTALAALSGPGRADAACSVIVEATTDVTLGAFQVDIDYGRAGGDFRGVATDVDCTDLAGADVISANDDDSASVLRIGWISLSGVDAPADMARCTFDSSATPAVGDFELSVVDASDPTFSPVSASARLRLEDCGNTASECGDVNSDGRLTSSDALLVLNAAVDLPAPLNCTGVPTETTTTSTTTTTNPPSRRLLSVEKTGAGIGIVTGSPGAISCGPSCMAEYADGTSVTLTASPSNGSVFLGWAGNVPPRCKDAGSLSCTFNMTRNRNVAADFGRVQTGCPQGSPIRDLRGDCSDTAYFYLSAVEAAGLTTDGIDVPIVVLPRDGGDGVAILGDVTGARSLSWTTACLLDQFGNVEACGTVPGNGTISSSGETLTLFLDGDSFRYNFSGTEALSRVSGVAESSPVGRAQRTLVTLGIAIAADLGDAAEGRANTDSSALLPAIKERL